MTRSAAVLLALAFGGCAGPADPEAQLRALITAAEAAAEQRDTGFFRDLIAPGYADSRGNDRQRLIDYLRGYFLVHREIDVVSRIATVEVSGADAARIVVHAGILGRRAGQPALAGLAADLYRIELELVGGDGAWRVIGASWERALGD